MSGTAILMKIRSKFCYLSIGLYHSHRLRLWNDLDVISGSLPQFWSSKNDSKLDYSPPFNNIHLLHLIAMAYVHIYPF